MRRAVLVFCLLCLMAAAAAQADDDRPERKVLDPGLQHAINRAIGRGIAYLKKAQNADGSWTYDARGPSPLVHAAAQSDATGGLTALALYALAASGVPADDRVMVQGLRYVAKSPDAFTEKARYGTYSASLLVLALTRIDPAAHKKRIQALATQLAASQLDNHMWTYRLTRVPPRYGREEPNEPTRPRRDPGRRPRPERIGDGGDNSNSQFAVLALWAAEAIADAKVPDDTWKRVLYFYLESQLADGGWGYHRPDRYGRAGMTRARHAMTAAGLVSYVYARAASLGGMEKLPEARASVVAQKGLALFGSESVAPYTDYYLVYSLERVGTVLNRPSEEWYDEGARALTHSQEDDGRWPGTGRLIGGRLGGGGRRGGAEEEGEPRSAAPATATRSRSTRPPSPSSSSPARPPT